MSSSSRSSSSRLARIAAAVGALALAAEAPAQTDEIQVYTGRIAEPGELGFALHANWIAAGLEAPRFPGGTVPDGTLNGVPELALGVADWLELGLYLPVFTVSREDGFQLDAAKLRALFVTPHAEDRRAYAGANLELSWNAPHWDPSHVTGEVRFLVGGRVGAIEVTLNPILETAFDGLGAVELAPAARVGWRASPRWTFALEEYAALGPLDGILPLDQQEHALFAVVDRYGERANVELGVGFGLTSSTDRLVLKLIFAPDL